MVYHMIKSCSIIFIFLILHQAYGQTQDAEVIKDQEKIIVGKTKVSKLKKGDFAKWYIPNYETYNLQSDVLDELSQLMEDVTVTVFMGTWCEDSQSLLPLFYRILHEIKYKERKIRLIGMDRDKKTPKKLEKDLAIQYVPTFIFYRNGNEIGRIEEYVMESFEQDMLNILKK